MGSCFPWSPKASSFAQNAADVEIKGTGGTLNLILIMRGLRPGPPAPRS